jgi:hypothetical protein
MRAVAAGGARPDEVDVGGRLLLLLGGGDGRGGGEVVLHGAHVVEAVAPCHGRSRSLSSHDPYPSSYKIGGSEFVRERRGEERGRSIESFSLSPPGAWLRRFAPRLHMGQRLRLLIPGGMAQATLRT